MQASGRSDVIYLYQKRNLNPGLGENSYISGKPWNGKPVDILRPFSLTNSGNKYLMVVTDKFSKWSEVDPIPVTPNSRDSTFRKSHCPAPVHNFEKQNRTRTLQTTCGNGKDQRIFLYPTPIWMIVTGKTVTLLLS